MLRLLIVDDEEIIREGIFRAGNWSSYDVEVVGSAGNGEEALNMVREKKPQVIISDIMMPDMDGISFISILNRDYPEIKVILLTGHRNFQFAKSAIDYKASSYLLKPARIEVIVEEVLKLKKEIEDELERNNSNEIMQQKLKESLPLLREQYLNNIVSYSVKDTAALMERFNYLGIALSSADVALMILQGGNNRDKSDGDSVEESFALKLSLKQLCSDIIGAEYNFCVFEDRFERVVALLNCRGDMTHWDSLKGILGKARRIQIEYNRISGLDITIGVGRLQKDISTVYEAYKEAVYALDYSFYTGKNSVIYFGDIKKDSPDLLHYPYSLEQDIIRSIRSGDSKTARELTEKFLNQLMYGKRISPKYVSNSCKILLGSIYHTMLEIDPVYEEKSLFMIDENFAEGESAASITSEDLKFHIVEVVSKYAEKVCYDTKLRNRSLLDNARDYIKKNICGDVSLLTVADAVHISPNHLSFLFKEELNENFKDYVTSTKMEKSMELINTTNYSSGKIADIIGYCDGYYFSKIFQKYFGKMPEQARQR